MQYKQILNTPIGGIRNRFFYQEGWNADLIPENDFDRIAARLAIAGSKLFFHLFEEAENQDLRSIANRISLSASDRSLVLTMTSDEYFIPWGMIYTQPGGGLLPDGSNFEWEGFWGYRHIIEHTTEKYYSADELVPVHNGEIPTSMNYDQGLDDSLGVQCIAPQLEFFKGLQGLVFETRVAKDSLRDAIANDLKDQILYFCCHGSGADSVTGLQQSPPALQLSDPSKITASEISHWLKGTKFVHSPIVFINACQGGQMNSLFFRSFVPVFLSAQARAVIGPQIDMPALFAGEYARKFFALFTDRSKHQQRTIGRIIRQLNREFIDNHKNPLGLSYSLFRGADCHIRWIESP